ncbi:MAG TPA: diguanylate cyclase, partial [Candidatus Caenarcaniphilales bacterium]|nr:diguanylate cyclase [Candidatus Caenarcaniphilales bacterium]
MRTEQLALLLGLVVLAMVALLGPLALRRGSGRRGRNQAAPDESLPGAPGVARLRLTGGAESTNAADAEPLASPRDLYERVVRVVSYLFIGSALVVVTATDRPDQPQLYLLLALGAFLIVLGQDILPMSLLGRWRLSVEVSAAIAFVTALVASTGGHQSPFFFGYVLLLAGASLRADGAGPFLLGLATGTAYLVGVTIAAGPEPVAGSTLGLIGFNLVSLALIAYVAAVIGREQRRAQEAALRLSRFDALTGVYSRMYFTSAIQQEILRAVRTGRPFSLLMMDLDGLKPVNDRFGHEFGDRLLRAVGEVIRRGIRLTDVAARYGGDEFVVVLPETDLQGALRVSEKLRLDIAELTLPQNRSVIQTSVSIGVVTYPDDGRSSSELMRRADHAMYEAKRRGRNQIVHYPRPLERRESDVPRPREPAPMGPGRP